MALSHPAPIHDPPIDLTAPPPLKDEADLIRRVRLDGATIKEVERVASESSHVLRVERLSDLFRRVENVEAARLLLGAAKLALRQEPAGLRVLCSFLNVRQPGVEVLRRLQSLSSLERVSLCLTAGRWRQPAGAEDESPAYPIVEMLKEATRVGILGEGFGILPHNVEKVQAVNDHLRRWFAWMALRLGAGKKVSEDRINFLVQISMLEIDLLERRLSRIAELVDPYDTRGMGRLMPILSRYDQDIDHLKEVTSRLTTYRPFYDRVLTMENAINETEMNKLEKELFRQPGGAALGRILHCMRSSPILERHFLSLVSALHQAATLRARSLDEATDQPDVLSTMFTVASHYREGRSMGLRIEDELREETWPVMETWGMFRNGPSGLFLDYREERSLEFIETDGTPRLPDQPQALEPRQLCIEELILSQMHNDAFIMGLFENAQAMAKTRVVPMIAMHTRSVRVLEKIMNARHLHTGPANKDVPRLILLNPARTPVNSLRRFIHVRFISRMDLQRMGTAHSDVRPEVRQEIQNYLRTITQS